MPSTVLWTSWMAMAIRCGLWWDRDCLAAVPLPTDFCACLPVPIVDTQVSVGHKVCLDDELSEVRRAAGALESRLAGTILQRIVQADDFRLILEFYGQAVIHRVLLLLLPQVCPHQRTFGHA